MEPMMRLQVAAILFGVAALGGLTMALIRWRRNTNPPTWFVLAHGLLAVAAFLLLAYTVLTASVPRMALYALALFALAALGGATLNFAYHRRGKLLPAGLVWGHGLTAAVGFTLLLLAVCPG